MCVSSCVQSVVHNEFQSSTFSGVCIVALSAFCCGIRMSVCSGIQCGTQCSV